MTKISIHALREEGDDSVSLCAVQPTNFYPRPPRGGRPILRSAVLAAKGISIHALREEGDSEVAVSRRAATNFYPRPPRGGRRRSSQRACRSRSDFYPRPPRGGRRIRVSAVLESQEFLSTPSARRATFAAALMPATTKDFYPRPPRGGRRVKRQIRAIVRSHFYPRPPRGGRLLFRCHLQRLFCISIHALREEGDRKRHRAVGTDTNFYPRPPRGGRPAGASVQAWYSRISIHALREEGDCQCRCSGTCRTNFYPRPPRGGRPSKAPGTATLLIFLSTPSARRATEWGLTFDAINEFLSTPSARRATWPDDAVNYCTEFLSTPSARRATGDASGVQRAPVISIHALREEGDPFRHRSERVKEDFYPRPPRGGRLDKERGFEP